MMDLMLMPDVDADYMSILMFRTKSKTTTIVDKDNLFVSILLTIDTILYKLSSILLDYTMWLPFVDYFWPLELFTGDF